MKQFTALLFIALCAFCAGPSLAQGSLDPAKVGQAPTDSWTSYHGDYSGRRFSTLNKINTTNINSLSLAWVYRTNTNRGAVKASPLVVNGVMYFTMPDHVWAIDARSGREIWHHAGPPKAAITIGNRGVGIFGDTLYVETAGLLSGGVESERRQRAMAQNDLRFGSVLLWLDCADHRQESRHHRHQRRRSGSRRIHSIARSGDGRDAMALVRRAAKDGRTRQRNLAERRSDETRRRHDVAADHL